jgi:hypothetical protein
LTGLTARAARHRDGNRDICAIKLRFGVTNRSLSRWVAVAQLAADQSEYAASILTRRARLLPRLMWDLDNTPLADPMAHRPDYFAAQKTRLNHFAHLCVTYGRS